MLFSTIQKWHVHIRLLSQLPSMDTDSVASYILLFNQAVWRKLPSPLGFCDLSWLMACHRGVMHGNLAGCVAHAWLVYGLTHTHTHTRTKGWPPSPVSVGDRKEKAPVLLAIVLRNKERWKLICLFFSSSSLFVPRSRTLSSCPKVDHILWPRLAQISHGNPKALGGSRWRWPPVGKTGIRFHLSSLVKFVFTQGRWQRLLMRYSDIFFSGRHVISVPESQTESLLSESATAT